MLRNGCMIAVAAAVAIPASVAAQPGLTMTCHPIYQGNDLGAEIYRVIGDRLFKTGPSIEGALTMSSAIRRQPLDRTVDRGVVTYSSASHSLRGSILVRRVFWTTARGRVIRSFTETYDFRAKTIHGLTGEIERCS